MQIPNCLPADFLAELQPRALQTLCEMGRRFTALHVMEAVKWVITELTPDFSQAVEAGKMSADSALSQMGGLLDLLLTWNSGGSANRLMSYTHQTRRSDEWRKLMAAVAAAERDKKPGPVIPSRGDTLTDTCSPDSIHTSVSLNTPSRQGGEHKEEHKDPEVAKRRTIVRNNPGTPAQGLCTLLDGAQVKPPKQWNCFNSWTQAYRNPEFRPRIHVIFAKDRKKP